MADTATKRPKLTEQQKTEVRALMADYRQSHPGVELKEVLAHLDVPYKDRLTVGVLRGLVPRKANGSSARLGNGRAAGKRASSQSGKRSANFEKVLSRLASLRKDREDLDRQIQELETELRQRLEKELGEEQTQRIFQSE